MRIRQTWENLKSIDYHKLIRDLFMWYILVIILDCATTMYGFEVLGMENCSLKTNETSICEGNPRIYDSGGVFFHLFAMIGIAYILRDIGEFNYSTHIIKFIGIVLSISVLIFFAGLTTYAVINNINLFFLYI